MTLAQKNPKIDMEPLLDLGESNPELGQKVVDVLHKCPEADVPVLIDLLETTPQMDTDKLGDIMAHMPKRYFERMLLPVAKVCPCSCGRARVVVVFAFGCACGVRLRSRGGVPSVVSICGGCVCARAQESAFAFGEGPPSAGAFAVRRAIIGAAVRLGVVFGGFVAIALIPRRVCVPVCFAQHRLGLVWTVSGGALPCPAHRPPG